MKSLKKSLTSQVQQHEIYAVQDFVKHLIPVLAELRGNRTGTASEKQNQQKRKQFVDTNQMEAPAYDTVCGIEGQLHTTSEGKSRCDGQSATPDTYPIRVEWIVFREPYLELSSPAGSDTDIPSTISTLSELVKWAKDDVGRHAPYGKPIFFAYNKNGNLVALSSDSRVRSWVKDLAGRYDQQHPAKIWVGNGSWFASASPSGYMRKIQKLNAQTATQPLQK